MEGAAPGQARRLLRRRQAERFVEDAADAALHLERGAAREGQQEEARRIGAGQDQAGDARRERQRLARAGAGDDQQRPDRRRSPAPMPKPAARCWASFSPAKERAGAIGGGRRRGRTCGRRRRCAGGGHRTVNPSSPAGRMPCTAVRSASAALHFAAGAADRPAMSRVSRSGAAAAARGGRARRRMTAPTSRSAAACSSRAPVGDCRRALPAHSRRAVRPPPDRAAGAPRPASRASSPPNGWRS